MRQIAEQLKQTKHDVQGISPDPSWVAKNKAQLLTQIDNTVSDTDSAKHGWSLSGVMRLMHLLAPKSMVHAARPLMSLATVAVIVVGGSIATVNASQTSLPGDTLWNVKIAAERTQQMVTRVTADDDVQAQLSMTLAQRRADEIKRVVSENKPNARERTDKAMKALQRNLGAVHADIQATEENESDKIITIAKDVNEKSDAIVLTLDEVIEMNADIDRDLAKKVVEASKFVENTSFDALEAALEHDSDGEAVKALLEKKIERIIQDTDEVDLLIGSLPDDVEATTSSSPVEVDTATTSSSPVEVDTATASPSGEDEVAGGDAKSVGEVKKEIEEKSGSVRLEIDLIRGLVEVNVLDEAVKKVRELSDVTAENKESVIEAKRMATENTVAQESSIDAVPDAAESTTLMTTSTTVETSTISVTQTQEISEVTGTPEE